MHNRFLILANLAFGCVALLATAAQAKEPDDADKTAARDEGMLRKAGLGTESKDVVAWLKQRSENDEDLGRIDKLIEQLGYTDKEKREAAQRKLAMLGLNGWTDIIKAAKRKDYPLADAAKACIEEIEKEHHAFLNLATVRLLVYRKSPEAVESLLRCQREIGRVGLQIEALGPAGEDLAHAPVAQGCCA